MNRTNYDEIFLQVLFFVIGFCISIKIFIPIINPATMGADISLTGTNFYQNVLDKANPAIGLTAKQDDEESRELGSLLFTYVTGIDLSNPRTYIASQIPILQFIDMTSILPKESGPVVIIPRDNTLPPENQLAQNNNTQGNSNNNKSSTPAKTSPVAAGGQVVKPSNLKPIAKKKLNDSKPQVLIYHTHTSETYNPDSIKGKSFSNNLNVTVAKVGETLEYELENTYGISTLHDTTFHDVPKRLGAYAKSRPTIQKYLKKYSTFKLLVDLHRDGEVSRSSETAIINNEKYARVMLVAGTKFKAHDKYNKAAQKLLSTFQSLYPGFCRGIVYKNGTYNQDLFQDTILIEVGSDKNSLDEALRSTKIIARVIAQYLK